jgi:hypothetical protein
MATEERTAGIGSPPRDLRPTRGIASFLNPFAGMHTITLDPAELEAARRAGELSLQHFPYYLYRYGERGRLFGQSDGAWLVTLCSGMSESTALEEITWLWSVLASRGMPGLLLEKHLECLEASLLEVGAGDPARWELLGHGAAHLRKLRNQHLADGDMVRIGEDFAATVGPEWEQKLPRMGQIIAAAVADDAAGVEKALTSVIVWAIHPANFPGVWRRAVERALEDARERLLS